eukprot:6935178-Alexandrium_andersonii.AAC.1
MPGGARCLTPAPDALHEIAPHADIGGGSVPAAGAAHLAVVPDVVDVHGGGLELGFPEEEEEERHL